MRVTLGKFAREEIEARFGDDIAAGVRAALEHYARRLESGPPPVKFPRFLRGQEAEAIAAEFRLPVAPGVRETLEREADRSGLSIEQTVLHAVFVYLADLDRESDEKRRGAISGDQGESPRGD